MERFVRCCWPTGLNELAFKTDNSVCVELETRFTLFRIPGCGRWMAGGAGVWVGVRLIGLDCIVRKLSTRRIILSLLRTCCRTTGS